MTRKRDFAAPGVHVVTTAAAALELARSLAAARGAGEIAVIGGAEVFRALLPFAERVYLTLVHAHPDGDVVLPPFAPKLWLQTSREPMQQARGDQFAADFIVLDRQR